MALAHLVVLVLFIAGYKPVTATGDWNSSCDFGKNENVRKTIHFAFMTTFSGSFVSSGTIPAVDLAIERVNNDSSLLQNYELNYTMAIDTKVRSYSNSLNKIIISLLSVTGLLHLMLFSTWCDLFLPIL